MKKNSLFITARDALVKEVSGSRIKATKGELKGYLDMVKESSAFFDELTLEDYERKHAKGRLSKTKLESIKKGLKLKDKLIKKDSRLGSEEGLFDLLVENTWRSNPDLKDHVDEILERTKGYVPQITSNNMVNDELIIKYADQLGVDKRDFIEHLMHGKASGRYKE